MTSVWLYTFYQGNFLDLGFMAEKKRDEEMTLYHYEVAFFFLYRDTLFLVIILCQIKFSEVSLARLGSFHLKS